MSTTRRSFFRSLGLLAGAASVSPTIFIPKFEPVRWKVLLPEVEFTEVIYHPRDYMGCWDLVFGRPSGFLQMCVRGWRLEEKAGRKLTYGEWESGVLGKRLEV